MALQRTLCISLVAAIAGYLLTAPAAGADALYEGKTIRFMVGARTGSGPDSRARWIARHLPKYIPGQPNITVQNMSGAGGVRVGNFLYRQEVADGLTLALVGRSLHFAQLAERQGVQYNLTELSWVGGLTRGGQIVFIRSDQPYRTLDELRAATQPIIFGARSVGGSNYVAGKALELLGVPVQLVIGYDSSQITLAFQSGEIQASSLSPSGLLRRAGWTDPGGIARLIVALGAVSAEGVPNGTDVDVPAENADFLRLLNDALGVQAAGIAAPPNTPEAYLAVLRQAFVQMLEDAAFVAEAEKLRLELHPVDGVEMAEIVRRFHDRPQAARDRFKALME